MIVNHYGGDFYLAQILWLCFILYSGGGSDRVFYKWICAISCYCYTAAFIIYFFLSMTKKIRAMIIKINALILSELNR